MQSVELVLAWGKVIWRNALWSFLSCYMVVGVHTGLDFDLGSSVTLGKATKTSSVFIAVQL